MGSSIEEQIDWLPLIPFSSNRSIIFYFISSKSKCNNLAKKLTRNLYFLCKIFNRMPPGASLQGDPISLSKNSVEMNPLKLERGSSRGRQPASSGIECPKCLAWQGVQRAQRGLFRRAAAGKYRHFSGCRKSLWTFSTACWARLTARPYFQLSFADRASSSLRLSSKTRRASSTSWR